MKLSFLKNKIAMYTLALLMFSIVLISLIKPVFSLSISVENQGEVIRIFTSHDAPIVVTHIVTQEKQLFAILSPPKILFSGGNITIDARALKWTDQQGNSIPPPSREKKLFALYYRSESSL